MHAWKCQGRPQGSQRVRRLILGLDERSLRESAACRAGLPSLGGKHRNPRFSAAVVHLARRHGRNTQRKAGLRWRLRRRYAAVAKTKCTTATGKIPRVVQPPGDVLAVVQSA